MMEMGSELFESRFCDLECATFPHRAAVNSHKMIWVQTREYLLFWSQIVSLEFSACSGSVSCLVTKNLAEPFKGGEVDLGSWVLRVYPPWRRKRGGKNHFAASGGSSMHYTLGNQKAERMGLEAEVGYDLQRPLLSDLCYQLDPTDSKTRAPALDRIFKLMDSCGNI